MALQLSPGYRIRSRATTARPALEGIELAIAGSAVDDRGRAAIDALRSAVAEVRIFEFDANSHLIYLDSNETRIDRLRAEFSGKMRVVLDATTWGSARCFTCWSRLLEQGCSPLSFSTLSR